MRRSIDGHPLTNEGDPLTLADCNPGDVVAIGERSIVLVGGLLGMRQGKRNRIEPHTAILHDFDPDTMLEVRRDDDERGLRRCYTALPSILVLDVVETVSHRRHMRQLVDRRQLLITAGDRGDVDVDPLASWHRSKQESF